ncbi:MAG: sigma-70 family RNA polymerase sigma factor [Alphaproteobacteria bacterium]
MSDGELRQTLHLHVTRLRRYARALVRDADQAEDLVQECLTVALSQAHRWTPGTDLRAWLFTILHNLHIGGLRKRLRQAEHVDLESVMHLLPEEPAQSMRLEWLEALWAFEQLEPEHREVLLLTAVEGFRYQETADILGVPLGTVMSRLSRARHRMRDVLARRSRPKLRLVKS